MGHEVEHEVERLVVKPDTERRPEEERQPDTERQPDKGKPDDSRQAAKQLEARGQHNKQNEKSQCVNERRQRLGN